MEATVRDILTHQMALADIGIDSVKERVTLMRIFANTFGLPKEFEEIVKNSPL